MASKMSRITIKQEPRPMYGFQLWDPREGTADGNVYPATGSLTLDNSTPWKLDNAVTSESNCSTADKDQHGHLDDLFKYDAESDSEDDGTTIPTHPKDNSKDQQLTWTEQLSTTTIPPFSAEVGPNFAGFKTCDATKPVDFFHQFFPEELYKQAQTETNNYAEYYQEKKRDLGRDWWEWSDETWEPVESKQEIRVFIGICIAMAVHTLPDPRDYWSKRKNLCNSIIAKSSMNVDHFDRIMHYFCLSNPWRDPEKIANLERRAEACNRDPLYKVSNSLLEYVKSSCINLYKPHQDVVMQELTGILGQKYKFKTNGWKLVALQDAHTGYVSNIQWYRAPEVTSEYPGFTLEHAVNSLIKSLVSKGHCVYAHNLFISPKMACRFKNLNTHITTNCSDWPNDIKNIDRDLKIGTFKSVQYNRITATVWHGKTLKQCLSTIHDGLMQPVTQKIRNPTTGQYTIETVLCPTSIAKHMAINDKLPQPLLLSQGPILQKLTNLWWKRMIWLLIDICINNAYVMWTASKQKHFSHSEFAMEVASNLIFDPRMEPPQKAAEAESKTATTSQEAQSNSCGDSQQSMIPASMQPTFQYIVNQQSLLSEVSHSEGQLEPGSDNALSDTDVEHCLVKFPGRGRNCKQCSADETRTLSGRRRDTQFGCMICGLNLCRSGCFVRYHEARGYKINPLTLTKTKLHYDPLPSKRKKLSF